MALTTPLRLESFLISLTAVALSLSACSVPSQTAISSQSQVKEAPLSSARPSSTRTIRIDGSSTVYPITNAIAGTYQQQDGKVPVTVNFSGTGGGFRKFCAGETEINNASRPILAKEMEVCKQSGVRYIELPIAFDALTVVVHGQNDWAKSITLAELKKIWEPAAQGKITRWNQVRADWPDQPLKLYGAGRDSGTFDYFTEVIVGQLDSSRSDYTASEDDEFLVEAVEKDPNALGSFGYGYYEANEGELKALAIDSGKGPVLPSRETVKSSEYQPLSRPLFIYVNAKAAQTKPEVRDFVQFYLTNAARWTDSEGYVPLPDEAYQTAATHFENGKVGTVFGGRSQLNLTIAELLRKEAQF
jgi:phosphate transport system substrate-binding protein